VIAVVVLLGGLDLAPSNVVFFRKENDRQAKNKLRTHD
jgi:hypothetical protein